MSTDDQTSKSQISSTDWPGRDQGVPQPPSKADIDQISQDQGLIADEWAPQPATKPNAEPKGS
jgi:hypothetical protein